MSTYSTYISLLTEREKLIAPLAINIPLLWSKDKPLKVHNIR
jgi:hypothetical protein